MAYERSESFLAKRFHAKQFDAWIAYQAGLTIVLPWGRRSGKSDFFAEVMIQDVEDYNRPCLYLASTQDSAREIMWPKFHDRLKRNPLWKLHDATMEAIYKPTGTPVRLRGIERVDNLAGKAYRLVIADEFALWKRDPETIVKQILAPMLADYNGQLMFGSSKRGKNHFYLLHQRALKNPSQYYVDECTIFDNPFISPEGREKIVQEYAGEDDPLYRQEIKNEYVSFQGMVFAIPVETYTTKRWDRADLDHSVHWRGVDHGFSPDPTACLWMAYNEKFGYYLIYNEYKQEKLLIAQHAEVMNAAEPFDYFQTISDVDPQIIAEYQAVGLHMEPAGKYDKQARLLRLVTALRSGKLKIAHNCTELLREMASYEWDQDGNDHLIDALNYVYTNAVLPEKPAEPEPFDPLKRVNENISGEGDF